MSRSRRELRRVSRVYAERRRAGREDRYAPFDPANLFRLQALERELAAALLTASLLPWDGQRALDVGCGGGWWLRQLLRWGAGPGSLTGVDALSPALEAAGQVHPDIRLVQASADALPFAAGRFELVSQFTVFSSILDAGVRQAAAEEMVRVLRPGGRALWYDFTVNPTNPDTHGIGVGELRRLFPGCPMRVRRVTLAPPLARLVVPRSRFAADLLERLPPLRTHLLALIGKPAGRGSQR